VNTQKGYTLIELLIALFIFSILSILTSYSLKRIMDTHHNIKFNYNFWQKTDSLIHELEHHSQSFINREMITKDKHHFPSFIGQHDYIEWTYTSRPNQSLKRIAYVCQGAQLKIRHWVHIIPTTRNEFNETIVLDHLSDCHFRYMNHKHQMSGFWQDDKHPNPKGFQLTLSWANHEKIQLWFTMPPYVYDIK